MRSAKPTAKAKKTTTATSTPAKSKLVALPFLAVKLLLAFYARARGDVWARNMEMSEDDYKGGTWTVQEGDGCVRVSYRPSASKLGSFNAKRAPIQKAMRLLDREIAALKGNIGQSVENSLAVARSKAKKLTAEALDRAVSKARSEGLKPKDAHKVEVPEIKVERVPGQREASLGAQLKTAESDLAQAVKDLEAVKPAPLVEDRTHEFPLSDEGMELLAAVK